MLFIDNRLLIEAFLYYLDFWPEYPEVLAALYGRKLISTVLSPFDTSIWVGTPPASN